MISLRILLLSSQFGLIKTNRVIPLEVLSVQVLLLVATILLYLITHLTSKHASLHLLQTELTLSHFTLINLRIR